MRCYVSGGVWHFEQVDGNEFEQIRCRRDLHLVLIVTVKDNKSLLENTSNSRKFKYELPAASNFKSRGIWSGPHRRSEYRRRNSGQRAYTVQNITGSTFAFMHLIKKQKLIPSDSPAAEGADKWPVVLGDALWASNTGSKCT